MLINARLITLAAFVALVAGQAPDQCILGCSQASLSSATNKSCKAFTDPCVCTDIGFQTAAGQCLQKNCTTQDQQTAGQLQKVLCGNTTASNSTGGTNSTSSASQTHSSTATSSAATTSQSSAAGAQIQAGQTGLFALSVAAAGAIVGGLLI